MISWTSLKKQSSTQQRLLNDVSYTCGLLLPPKPIVTTESTVVAPRLVLAGTSVPVSVFANQNVTQEQHTSNANGT